VKIVYCSKCGFKLGEGVKSCPNCGQVTNDIENTATQKSLFKKATASRKNLYICLGILAIVLILTIAGVYGLRPREGKATLPIASATPSYNSDNQSVNDETSTQATPEPQATLEPTTESMPNLTAEPTQELTATQEPDDDRFTHTASQLTDGWWLKRGDRFAQLGHFGGGYIDVQLNDKTEIVTAGDEIIFKMSKGSMPDIWVKNYLSNGFGFGFGVDVRLTSNKVIHTIHGKDVNLACEKAGMKQGSQILSINGNEDFIGASYGKDEEVVVKIQQGTSVQTLNVIPFFEYFSFHDEYQASYTYSDDGYVVFDNIKPLSGYFCLTFDGYYGGDIGYGTNILFFQSTSE